MSPRTVVGTQIVCLGSPKSSQQPFPFSEHEPNATSVPEQPGVSMPDPGFPETLDDPVDDNDREEQPSTEPVPHSSSSHWEWRPEFEVPPPEPGDPVAMRRRIIAKRTLTAAEEEESRQKRMKWEQVPELFPLTTLPTSSPTLTSDGESAILQWIVNEGYLLESGDERQPS